MEDNERPPEDELLDSAEELIAGGKFYDAQKLLESVKVRNGRWHFTMGKLYNGMKWTNEARKHFQLSVAAEPDNDEFKGALDELEKVAALENEKRANGEYEMGEYEFDCPTICNCCFDCLSGCSC